MRGFFSIRMAYRHFRADLGGMLLSVFAVALGVAVVTAFRLMAASIVQSFVDVIDEGMGRASLSITAGDGLGLDANLLERVTQVPGVALAVPLVRGTAFPNDESNETLVVYGIDLLNEHAVRMYQAADDAGHVVDDPLMFVSQLDSILLGREFAMARGLRVGEALTLVTPIGTQQFTIRGLLETQGLARTLAGRLVIMDLPAAQRAFAAEGTITQIDILLEQNADLDATRQRIATVVPAGLRIEEPGLRKAIVRKSVGAFETMFTAFGLLLIFAGFIVSYSRLSAILDRRIWEVGLLRAAGLSRTAVLMEMGKEGLLVGAAGVVVGIPLAIVIAQLALPFLAATVAINFNLSVNVFHAVLSPAALALGACVGIGAAVLSVIPTAFRLAWTQPIAALTMRGREFPVDRKVVVGRFALCLAGAIVGLVVWQRYTQQSWIGLVTTGVIAIAACLLPRPLVASGSLIFAPAAAAVFGLVGRHGIKHLERRPRGTVLTVATIGFGLGVVLLFGTLGTSFEQTIVSKVLASVQSDLVISSALLSGGYRESPMSEEVVGEIARIPGVAAVAGTQSREVPYGTRGTVTLKAYDTDLFNDTRLFEWPLEYGALPDALGLVSRGEGVFVSSSFAFTHRVHAGETIVIDSPSGPQQFKVVGVATGQPENAVIVTRARYTHVWNDPFIYIAYAAVMQGANPTAVREEILRRVGQKYRLLIRSRTGLAEYFAGKVRKAFASFYILGTITLVIVLLSIGDALAAGVAERRREFGMMRALGLPRFRLSEIVLIEGLAIGLLGVALAMLVGMALGIFWVLIQFPAMLGWGLTLHFPISFTFGIAVTALLLCVIGAMVPSIRAARMSVPAALRQE